MKLCDGFGFVPFFFIGPTELRFKQTGSSGPHSSEAA